MPIAIDYLDNNNSVVLTLSGTIQVNQLISSMSTFFDGEKYLNLKDLTGDNTDCNQNLPRSEDMKKLAVLTIKESLRSPKILLAIVSPSDLMFGLSRVFLAYCRDCLFKVELFRNREDADMWVQQNA